MLLTHTCVVQPATVTVPYLYTTGHTVGLFTPASTQTHYDGNEAKGIFPLCCDLIGPDIPVCAVHRVVK